MVVITSLAILGAGIVTGLLFAFSNFVMTALARLPEEHGMFAMQQINEKIINPIFLLFFLGTPGLCIVLAIGALLSLQSASDLLVAFRKHLLLDRSVWDNIVVQCSAEQQAGQPRNIRSQHGLD